MFPMKMQPCCYLLRLTGLLAFEDLNDTTTFGIQEQRPETPNPYLIPYKMQSNGCLDHFYWFWAVIFPAWKVQVHSKQP